MQPIIIIGSGLAGYTLAREWRKLDQTSPLTIITTDNGDYYSKPQLSAAHTHNKTADALAMLPTTRMAEQLRAEILTATRVMSIQPEQQQLLTEQGQTLNYQKLVLALGADVIRAPIAGSAADAVYTVNNLDDYRKFRNAIAGKRRITIIGAGLIGCEFANDLINAGYQIDVVALDKAPLERLLPLEASLALQEALAEQGISWHLETTVAAIEQNLDGYLLTLNNGQQIESDIVLSAIGIKPHTQLAQASGLQTNRGIVVDQYLQTSAPNIYALGDCAEVCGITLFYLAPLFHCARALAHTLTGQPTAVHYPAMPVIIKTPSCPIAVTPPPIDLSGKWQIEKDARNVRALFYDENHQLRGFALTGDYIKESMLLAKQLPNVLEIK